MLKKKLVLVKVSHHSNYIVSKAHNTVDPKVGSSLTEKEVEELIAFNQIDVEIKIKE